MPELQTLLLAALVAFGFVRPQHVQAETLDEKPSVYVGYITVHKDITLRRMVVTNGRPKGTVLLLHGFPETLYAWKDVALELSADFEVHAFDWPGYGRSSRPLASEFSYSPKDYALVLSKYIQNSGIDASRLVIYATDIAGLPTLLLALQRPGIAKTIIVGDFAPFNRPQYMYESLQRLKSKDTSEQARIALNKNRDDILENAYRRGLPLHEQFDIPRDLKLDMVQGWTSGSMTSADAFHRYYSYFTRDQDYLESNLAGLYTPLRVVWGENDLYISKRMGIEFAVKTGAKLTLFPGVGHYPHLQNPKLVVDEIRTAFQ